MDQIGPILQAIAALAWPIIVIIILFSFRGAIMGIIGSAKERKFTVKVGDYELTMEEASKQQRDLIVDLQNQIVTIQKTLATIPSEQPRNFSLSQGSEEQKVKSILWVDDKPKNNATLVDYLDRQGIKVITALSTADALGKIDNFMPDRIVSDMGRVENGQFNPTAGLNFTRQIRSMGLNIPIIIFSSARSAQTCRDDALAAGAKEITSSPTVLLNFLQVGTENNVPY